MWTDNETAPPTCHCARHRHHRSRCAADEGEPRTLADKVALHPSLVVRFVPDDELGQG